MNSEQELRTYGCTRAELNKMMETTTLEPMMLAISILSDAQTVLERQPELSKQYINKATYVIGTQLEKNR